MFHEIASKDDTYAISYESFEVFLNYLLENRKIVDVETLVNEKNKDNVVLTFDDAYASIFEYAYPLLQKYQVPYYVFICNEYLDKDQYLNKDMLKQMLDDSRCIIGSHGYHHELSRFMKDEVLLSELRNSKKELEDIFSCNIDSLAFPYGSMYAVSDENVRLAENIFDYVFMTYNLPYNSEDGRILPRININETTYVKEIE